VRAGKRGHPNAGERPQCHRLEAQILIRGAALGWGHLAAVALKDLRKRGSFGEPPIDHHAVVDPSLNAASPLLGERLVIERSGLRRKAGFKSDHSEKNRDLGNFLEPCSADVF